ncbi:hypothetical protein ABT174_37935 [Streptomyces sparsogenes]|uniref:hypothetical protein n=1 Tax=Streptomyces sparsogenes TaxID=67365 RepID=UPI003326D647
MSADVFQSLPLPNGEMTDAEQATMQYIRTRAAAAMPLDLHPLRGPRTYEGAWVRAGRAGVVNSRRTPQT